MSDDTPDKIPTYDEALAAVNQPYGGRWWAIIGVILVIVYPLFYLFTPLTNEQIHLSVNDVIPFLKETVMAFILFPLLLIISFTVFLRWKRVGDWFAKWKPEKAESLDHRDVLRSVAVCKVYNSSHLELIIKDLGKYVNDFKAKLVIIDGIISLHRAEFAGRGH